jgi:hypothetical protein
MTLHTKISYAKSGLRFIGYIFLVLCFLDVKAMVETAGVILILAELLGIAEELPGMYKGTDTGSALTAEQGR